MNKDIIRYKDSEGKEVWKERPETEDIEYINVTLRKASGNLKRADKVTPEGLHFYLMSLREEFKEDDFIVYYDEIDNNEISIYIYDTYME